MTSQLIRNAVQCTSLFVLLTVLGACSDGNDRPLPTAHEGADAELMPTIPAHHQLATFVAAGLADATARNQLRQAMDTSSVKEGKVFLRTFLEGAGERLLQSIQQHAGVSPSAILALIDQIGPLEIYMPGDDHRAAWGGGAELVVGTQLEDMVGERPFGVTPSGRRIEMSEDSLPTLPTIAVVPSESFDPRGRPYERDLSGSGADALGASALARGGLRHVTVQGEIDGGGGGSGDGSSGDFTGIWVNSIQIGGDYEASLRGDPEYEMFVEYADDSNSSNHHRVRIRCSNGSSSTEPFYWDFNGENNAEYNKPFLIAEDGEIPADVRTIISLWEDDQESCAQWTYQGEDYIRLASQAIENLQNAWDALQERDYQQAGTDLVSGVSMIIDALEGSDEFIGVVSSDDPLIDTTERHHLAKDDNAVDTAILYVQWATRNEDDPGIQG